MLRRDTSSRCSLGSVMSVRVDEWIKDTLLRFVFVLTIPSRSCVEIHDVRGLADGVKAEIEL